ncbi:tyrosine lyase ThiH [Austwickia chelonae]|uniref:Thiazole biosynthesis protein ThiH n=1 Tax=Austwickia chelonae NBRC 105200 TaxID=1184607 RepID=K6WBB3_9MICO|nr:2-iminoacetate synthase ThiH [Austwickia chelonae]GAB79117.1 thiazole biosynthesis protein ThiH [Austwickia chelonae NBRC 105200]SEW42404.1 tyrosine lyase ThiH [Austwickia chelonae]
MTKIPPVVPLPRRADGKVDHMSWRPQFDRMHSGVMEAVLAEAALPDFAVFGVADVRAALARRRRSRTDLAALLSPAAGLVLEEVAAAAQRETLDRFGTSISMFTPLYVSNYCQNICTYCGFSCTNRISRVRLDEKGTEAELKAIAATGLEEVLILTGESAKFADASFISRAVRQASRYFPTVGIEVQPLSVADYRMVHEAGADFVSVYQETYDTAAYDHFHPSGYKRHFPYRFESQERALEAGMRGVSFGALLGLSDFRRDAYATAVHAQMVQQRHPHAEIGFSVPRLRPIMGGRLPLADQPEQVVPASDVHEPELLQVMCAYRLFLPFASITISTRERAAFRDGVLGVAATKVSAGVSTGVGEHAAELEGQDSGDEQFAIADERSVAQVRDAIRARGLQPVMTDHLSCGRAEPRASACGA